MTADVTRDGDLDRAVSEAVRAYGKLDIVVANAGFGIVGSFAALTVDDYRRQLETNVFGLLRTLYAGLSEVRKARGNLVLIGSVAGWVSAPGGSPYSVSKFAVRALANAITPELGARRCDGDADQSGLRRFEYPPHRQSRRGACRRQRPDPGAARHADACRRPPDSSRRRPRQAGSSDCRTRQGPGLPRAVRALDSPCRRTPDCRTQRRFPDRANLLTNPAVQIMHSKDLVNWELASYCIDRLDLGPAFRLEGGNIYGRGIWAPCIRYHKARSTSSRTSTAWACRSSARNPSKGPGSATNSPAGTTCPSSSMTTRQDLHHLRATAPYPIEELTPDLKAFVPDVRHQLVVPAGQRMGEGHHLYKIKGKYVDVSAIPGGPVDQMVAVADSIDGPWKVEHMVQGESLGVPTDDAGRVPSPNDRGLWLHQGGMVDTPSGEWWSIIMSDHGSAGRMVALVPITWDNGFPLIGLPGNLRKAPNTWVKPNTGHTQEPKPAFVHDDNFDGGKLNPLWQWNHVPDDTKWSLTEKPGVLRLHSLPAANFYNARNTPLPAAARARIDHDRRARHLGSGGWRHRRSGAAEHAVCLDRRGERRPRARRCRWLPGSGPAADARGGSCRPPALPTIGPATPPAHLWLRVHCNFDTDQAIFSWSADGKAIHAAGQSVHHDLPVDDLPGRASRRCSTSTRPASPAAMPTSTTTRSRSRVPAASSARFRWARPSRSPAAPTAASWPPTPGRTCSSTLRRTAGPRFHATPGSR